MNNALIAALADTSPKLRERAAAAIAVAKPPGALPKLAALLNDQGMVRDSVVQAIAAYGVEARPYISALQKLLTEPVGAPAPERVRAAIDAIEKLTPLPPPEPRVKAVNLAAGNQTAAPSGVAATVTPHPAPTTRVPSATPAASPQSVMPIAQTPTATVEHRVPIWPWVVGILALIVIVAVVLKRRA